MKIIFNIVIKKYMKESQILRDYFSNKCIIIATILKKFDYF